MGIGSTHASHSSSVIERISRNTAMEGVDAHSLCLDMILLDGTPHGLEILFGFTPRGGAALILDTSQRSALATVRGRYKDAREGLLKLLAKTPTS
jgi:hypothetical protein